jgi:hypothetical protein
MGLGGNDAGDEAIWKAGSGVLKRVGSGRDGTFLKRGSGVPMSLRTSQHARQSGKYKSVIDGGSRANISKPTLAEGVAAPTNASVKKDVALVKKARRGSFGEVQKKRREFSEHHVSDENAGNRRMPSSQVLSWE